MSDERAPNSLPLRKARNSTTGHVVRKRATTTYGPARATYGPAPSPAPGGAPADPAQGGVSPQLNGDASLGQAQTWGSAAWPPRYTPMPPPQVPPTPFIPSTPSTPSTPSVPPGQPGVNGALHPHSPAYQPPADPRFPAPRPASLSQPVIRSGRITGRPGTQPAAPRYGQALPPQSSNSVPLRPGHAGAVTSLQQSAAANGHQAPRASVVSNSVPLGSSGGPMIRSGRITGAPAPAVRPAQPSQSARSAQPRRGAPPPPRWASPLVALPAPSGGLLGSPTVQLAGRVLRRYARSIWLPAELLFVGLLFFIAFRSTFDTTYFFGTANFGLGLLSILGTYVLAQRVMPARMYVRGALREGRRPRVGGILLASGILRAAYLLLLLALALAFQRMPILDLSALAVGTLGLLANCVLIAAVTLALASPIATQLKRVVFLAWLVAALYSYSYGDRLAAVLAFTRVPLMPFSLTYALSVTGQIGSDGLLGLLVELAYIGGLIFLADHWLAGRLAEKMARRAPVSA